MPALMVLFAVFAALAGFYVSEYAQTFSLFPCIAIIAAWFLFLLAMIVAVAKSLVR